MSHTLRQSALLATAVGILLAPLLASAATGLRIQPVKISVTLHPGENTSGTIELTNVSDSDVHVGASLQDFVPLAGADTIQFVGRAKGVTSVKDWITLPGTSIDTTFKQGEVKTINYTITAPANAEPGGHYGVVFFKAVPISQAGGSLQIGTQVGMLVLVTVPGNHLERGRILQFSVPSFVQQGPVDLRMKFENTGTVHFEPHGQIIIKNIFGAQVASIPIEGEIVLPTSIKDLSFPWNVSGLLLGRYTAEAQVTDTSGDMIGTASTSFWAFPIWYGIAFLITLIIVFLILRFLKSRIRISIVTK